MIGRERVEETVAGRAAPEAARAEEGIGSRV
jgi:hypothetical protein